MTALWTAVLIVALAGWGMKAAGPVALGGRELPGRARDVIALLAPVLLAALLVTELAGPRWSEVSWTQLVGVGVVGAARALKAPILVAVAAGVVATALLRLAVA